MDGRFRRSLRRNYEFRVAARHNVTAGEWMEFLHMSLSDERSCDKRHHEAKRL